MSTEFRSPLAMGDPVQPVETPLSPDRQTVTADAAAAVAAGKPAVSNLPTRSNGLTQKISVEPLVAAFPEHEFLPIDDAVEADPTVFTLLLEFEYPETHRPIDLGINEDSRALAITFQELRITCRKTGDELAHFTFYDRFSTGLYRIYGLGSPEERWGTWSIGKRTAILLALPRAAPDGATIEFTYKVSARGQPHVPVIIMANGHLALNTTLSGGAVTFKCPPIVGFREIYPDRQNVSLDIDASPDVSIAVLSCDRSALTIACVASILKSAAQVSYEIIVVDNGSSAEQTALLRSAHLPVRIVFLSENRGVGEGNNVAAEIARGQFMLFLHNDAFLTGRVLDRLRQGLSGDPDAGLVGPILRFPDDTAQEFDPFANVDGFKGSGREPAGQAESTASLTSATVDCISGACMMCKREDFLRVGGFLPVFDPFYFEDVDLCLRFRSIGKSAKVIRDAAVYHIQHATIGAARFKRMRELAVVRNYETLRSRWGDWLGSRSAKDLPALKTRDVGELQAQIAGYAAENVNCLFSTEPLDGVAESQSSLATMVALAQLRPTVLATRAKHSVMHVTNLGLECGIACGSLATADWSGLATLDIETFVLSSRVLPPAVPAFGRRRILHCPHPNPLGNLSESELRESIQRLLKYEMIVTDSESGRQACLHELRVLRAPMMRIEVVRPPIAPFDFDGANDGATGKENIIVSVGPLRAGPNGGSHEIVAGAFNECSLDDWRLIVCGDLGRGDDISYLAALRSVAQRLNVDIVVNPSRSQLRDLVQRAKVYVSAVGLGAEPRAGERASANSAPQIGAAIAAGCVPVITDLGAAVEICEHVGVGFRFHYAQEIAESLRMAAERADMVSSGAAIQQRLEAFSLKTFHEAWQGLLSGTGADGQASGSFQLRASSNRSGPVAARAITVIGMHRSGTSAMARVISLLGAALPNELMPAKHDNPTGFWEPKNITNLNNKILRELESGWEDFFSFTLDRRLAALPGEFLAQARQQIRASYAGSDLIVLKDPRISILSRLWERALLSEGYEPTYVIMVRDPREVAELLLIRDGFPRSKGLLLWANYLVAAERDTRGARRAFILYGDLLDQPEVVLARLEKTLELDFPRHSATAGVEIERFLRRDLRHHVVTSPWNTAEFRLLDDVYRNLVSASRGGAVDSRLFSELENWLDYLEKIIGPTIASLRAQK